MSGLSVGMFLFLVSVGMSLIFGVTRIVNLAHGSFYMVGAYLMVTLMETLPEHAVSFWIALVLAPIGVGLLGGVIEVTLLRRIYHREPLLQLILTFGLVLVIGGLGSFAGSFVSALLVGELQSFGILIFPAVSIVLLFAIMAVVLIVRPWGLLGRPEE